MTLTLTLPALGLEVSLRTTRTGGPRRAPCEQPTLLPNGRPVKLDRHSCHISVAKCGHVIEAIGREVA